MHEMPKISVVVPFYNADHTLPLCLKGLLSQSRLPCEVILVDNNSTDQSAEIAKKIVADHPHTFRYLLETRQGPSSARNRGAGQAGGDIIVFTDADCIPDPNWLSDIAETFNDPQIGAVAGRIVGFGAETLFDTFHYLFTLRGSAKSLFFTEFTLVKGGFPTANLAVRKDVFNNIGGFDESMKTSGEDYDLCARIYQKGFGIQYIPRAVVYHQHRNSLGTTWWQSFGFGVGHAVLLRKHFKQMIIIDLPRYQYMSRKWPIRMWLDLAGADKKFFGLALLSIVWWPLSVLLALYLLLLFENMGSRLRQNGLSTGFFQRWQLVLLLFFKSIAFTGGRVVGSLRNRVICF